MSKVSKALFYYYDSVTKTYKSIADMENVEMSKYIPKVEMYYYSEEDDAYLPLVIDGKIPVNDDIIEGVSKNLDDKLDTKRDVYKKITINDLQEDVLSAMTGGATINVQSIPQDNSVTPEKTTFLQRSKNIFDKSKPIQTGKTYNTDGSIINDSTRWLSEQYIPVTQGMKIVTNVKSQIRIVVYQEDKVTQVGSRTGTTADAELDGYFTYTVSAITAKFIRISALNSVSKDSLMISNDGILRINYEPYGVVKLPASYIPHEVDDRINSVENGLSNLPPKTVTPEKTTFITETSQAFNKEEPIQVGKTFDTDGSIIDDNTRWLSEQYIPVTQGTVVKTNASSQIRVILYTSAKAVVGSRTGTTTDTDTGRQSYTVTSSFAKFIRISAMNSMSKDNLMITVNGEYSSTPEPYGEVKLKPEYIPDITVENAPSLVNTMMSVIESYMGQAGVDEDAVLALIDQHVDVKSPYPPRFDENAKTLISHDTSRPMWLSEDGTILYGHLGSRVQVSTDEWATKVNVGSALPNTVTLVRPTPDGELIVATNRNDSTDTRAKLYKSSGFSMANPSATTWTEVLSATGQFANFQNNWGIHIHDDVMLASGYGLKGSTGARYVYLSRDNGVTWTTIFDQALQNIPNRPVYTERGHIHTIQFDPYFNRIWLAVGDDPNTAVYFSDNFGQSWTFVTGSNVVQYTGIICMEDCVVFGSDRAPNGLHIYKRKDKATMPVIEPWFLVNNSNNITHIFNLPYRRNMQKGTPVYFTATTASDTNGNTCIMAFIDGRKANLMYDPTPVYGTTNGGQGVQWALGNTAQGNVIVVIQEPSPATGYKVVKWTAPTWE